MANRDKRTMIFPIKGLADRPNRSDRVATIVRRRVHATTQLRGLGLRAAGPLELGPSTERRDAARLWPRRPGRAVPRARGDRPARVSPPVRGLLPSRHWISVPATVVAG